MRRNKSSHTSKRNNIRVVIISMLPILAFLFSFWLVILGVKSYLKHASYFKIKRIVLNGINDKNLAQNISRTFLYNNIFSLDLKKTRQDLKATNPQFYDVDVIKNFPDQLTINVVVRRPVVMVRHKGFFLVDSEGVVVSDMSREPLDQPILISGLKGINSLSFGKRIHWYGFKSGLRLRQLFKDIRQDLISLIPKVATQNIEIDLSQYPSFYVYLAGVEVRLYDSDLENKLRLLLKILPTINKRIEELNYIDLRFVEPVVSFSRRR
jgi:cell division septal protein FtsQ